MEALTQRFAAMDEVERIECLLRNYKHVWVHLGPTAVAALVLQAEELGLEIPKGVRHSLSQLRRRKPKEKDRVRTNPLPEGKVIRCWLPACPPWLLPPTGEPEPVQAPERPLTLVERMEAAGRRLRR